jgi:branched-chain amino acid transport system substrate-binding protein
MQSIRWKRPILPTLIAGAMFIGACASGDGSGGASSEATEAPSGTGSGSTASNDDQAGAQTVADAEEAAARRPLQAEGEPVVIGFQTPEGDPSGTFPQFRIGAEAAVEYINEELGGIGANYETGTPGRPIELEVCTMSIAPEDSQRCANELVESDPYVVISTLNFFGNHLATYRAADIPVVVGTPVTVNDFTSPGVFSVGGGGGCLGMDTGRIDYMTRVLELSRIAVGYIDTAPGRTCYESFSDKILNLLAGETPDGDEVVAEGNDMLGSIPDLTHVGVPFLPGQADLTPQVTDLLEFEPDGISYSGQLADCWSVINSLLRLGWTPEDIPLAMSAGCIDPARLEELGETVAGITFIGAVNVSNPAMLAGQLRAEAETYQAKMEQYAEGGSEQASQGFTSLGFGLAMTVWEIANEQVAGDPAALDPVAFAEVMGATEDHHAYLSSGISCADGADNAPYVSVCSTLVTATQWDGQQLVQVEEEFSGFSLLEGTELEGS